MKEIQEEPLYSFGTELGITLPNISNPTEWIPEKESSSKMGILPSSAIVRKQKERSLDSTVYEIFSTVFMSRLLKQYNQYLSTTTFYCPEVLRLEYGQKGTRDNKTSILYEFFCPGTPLNKIERSRRKDYFVGGEPVRIEDRVMYLSGAISKIFLREGLVHGDPQLRHFILLPNKGEIQDISMTGQLGFASPQNGLGIIDLENMRILDSSSETLREDQDKFKRRVYRNFSTERSNEFFEGGSKIIESSCRNFLGKINTYDIAFNTFNCRFPNSYIQSIDMQEGRPIWKKN